MKWKVEVLKHGDWQDLNPEFFTFTNPEDAAAIAKKYNQNPNPYTYRAIKAEQSVKPALQ